MRVTNLQSPTTDNPVANQFIVDNGKSKSFQSYETLIAKETNKTLTIDTNALEYSQTTTKYLKQFLNTDLSKKQLQELLQTGNTFKGKKVVIKDLNK